MRLYNIDWSSCDQENDYSFNPTSDNYTENIKITVYVNDVLVYGTQPNPASGKKFLVIISNPLYQTDLITQALNTYMADLSAESWALRLIKVNNVTDPSADYVCSTPAALKTVIQSFYYQQYVGFVLIGSPPAIPTAFWRYCPDPSETINPTDLFYADTDSCKKECLYFTMVMIIKKTGE